MKKVLSVLVAALMLAALCVPAFAAGEAVTMKVSKTEVAVGDTVTVTVSVKKLSGLTALVKYDTAAFELVDAKASAAMVGVVNKDNAGEVKYAGAAVDLVDGALMTVTLKYKGGEGVITLDVLDALDADDATVAAVLGTAVKTATVTEKTTTKAPAKPTTTKVPAADKPAAEKPAATEKTTAAKTTTKNPTTGGSVSVAASAAAVVVMAAAVAYTMKKKDEE